MVKKEVKVKASEAIELLRGLPGDTEVSVKLGGFSVFQVLR